MVRMKLSVDLSILVLPVGVKDVWDSTHSDT